MLQGDRTQKYLDNIPQSQYNIKQWRKLQMTKETLTFPAVFSFQQLVLEVAVVVLLFV